MAGIIRFHSPSSQYFQGEVLMLHLIGLIISLSVFTAALIISGWYMSHPEKQSMFLRPISIFTAGVFLSATIMFFPLNYDSFEFSVFPPIGTFLASVHTAIRLFIVDCDFDFVLTAIKPLDNILKNAYLYTAAVLFVISPILTVGSVLSFFANLSARFKYWMCYSNDKYIFSELNERSLALATSFKQADKNRLIIFTDVFKKDDEVTYELIERAKKLNAILFKSDIAIINFRHHNKKHKLYFFIIGEDELENLNHVKELSAKPDTSKLGPKNPQATFGYDIPYDDVRLFLFTTNFNSEQLLSAINTTYMKIRRINDVQSLVYNLLYSHGMEIFEKAKETGKTGQKVLNKATGKKDDEYKISTMIVGLGLHGTEMLKGLSWFCQMHPYKLEVNAFDLQPNADQIFQSACPDLFDRNLPMGPIPDGLRADKRPFHNGDFKTAGEAHYAIRIFPGTDVNQYAFDEMIQQFADTTYVFVALGNDNLNIQIATKIRILLRRLGCNPVIHTIIYNPTSPQHYDSKYVVFSTGDIVSNYSEECLLNSELEHLALERHLKYVKKVVEHADISEEEKEKKIQSEEESFWKIDYNYRSSIASAIHTEYKHKLGTPGIEKDLADRTEDEKWFYRYLEHQRWNAYVRSEGFVFAPVRDKVAKTHHLLIPFDELDQSEQEKDDD